MITKLIAIILLLLFVLQIVFNILLRIEETKFKFRSSIKEKDVRTLLRRLKYVLWITPTKINLNRVNLIYSRVIDNDAICLDTQWTVYTSLNRRFIRNLQKPKELPNNPFNE